jgi:tRNA threonylcarbamoyladenosine biosynthesis protein TsaB
MAEGTGEARVIVCLDARMNEIYHAAYERSGGAWRAVHEPTVCAAASAPPVQGAGWLACGSGFRAYRDALEARYAGNVERIAADVYPRAADIARLAGPRIAAGDTLPPEHAAPVYVRNKVALRIHEQIALRDA